MKKISVLVIWMALQAAFTSCHLQNNTPEGSISKLLSAAEFQTQLQQKKEAMLIDVRTPEEYQKGHLPDAINMDYNAEHFRANIEKLDRSTPVFLYCLSGGRSGSAAEQLQKSGFREIYDLKGGIMKWRAAGFPEVREDGKSPQSMTLDAYNTLLQGDQIVLIDFYADWCGPCKKMAPYLAEIAAENKGRVKVIRINADDNVALLKDLKIDTLPTILVYKQLKITWKSFGLVTKKEILTHLD